MVSWWDTDEELIGRFRQVGGIPRHLFMPEEAFSRCLQSQKAAIRALTFEQAQEIFEGDLDAVGSFGANQPKSSLIGYAMLPGEIVGTGRSDDKSGHGQTGHSRPDIPMTWKSYNRVYDELAADPSRSHTEEEKVKKSLSRVN